MNRYELDIVDSDDILGTLEDLFDDLSIEKPTGEQLYRMYGIFLNDIVNNPIMIGGIELSYNKNISRHPVCRGKMQAFEHLITRESKYKGKREFDRERANKIHWIRPIIENVSDARIKYFERVNDGGYNQRYYWYDSKGFMVIIRELNPDLFLITSFSVDSLERPMYRTWYNVYKAK
jgi:hypothetical protein